MKFSAAQIMHNQFQQILSTINLALTTLVGRLSLSIGWENGPERGLIWFYTVCQSFQYMSQVQVLQLTITPFTQRSGVTGGIALL